MPVWLKVTLIFLAIAVCAYFPLRPWLIPRAKGSDANGIWVGTVQLNGYATGWGHTSPMTRQGVLYLDLSIYDSFLGKYQGTGEILLAGEQARPLKVINLWLSDGQHDFSAFFEGNFAEPAATATGVIDQKVHGDLTNETMTIYLKPSEQDNVGFGFHATLHRGTMAEYNQARASGR